MVTLRELAKKADVSASTISKVLNEKTTRVPISAHRKEFELSPRNSAISLVFLPEHSKPKRQKLLVF